jgi:hypothetical protein
MQQLITRGAPIVPASGRAVSPTEHEMDGHRLIVERVMTTLVKGDNDALHDVMAAHYIQHNALLDGRPAPKWWLWASPWTKVTLVRPAAVARRRATSSIGSERSIPVTEPSTPSARQR